VLPIVRQGAHLLIDRHGNSALDLYPDIQQ
jgi:hypothetical protein